MKRIRQCFSASERTDFNNDFKIPKRGAFPTELQKQFVKQWDEYDFHDWLNTNADEMFEDEDLCLFASYFTDDVNIKCGTCCKEIRHMKLRSKIHVFWCYNQLMNYLKNEVNYCGTCGCWIISVFKTDLSEEINFDDVVVTSTKTSTITEEVKVEKESREESREEKTEKESKEEKSTV
jgi:hypothetical protein